jgi:hypothetical protein
MEVKSMKLILALGIMVSIQVVMFLGQTSVDHIANDYLSGDGTTFFNYENSTIQKFDSGSFIVKDTTSADFPESNNVESGTGNIFTDTFNSAKNWFLDKTGINYLLDIANAPKNQLRSIGLPPEVSFALGFMWNAIIILLIIAFVLGRVL